MKVKKVFWARIQLVVENPLMNKDVELNVLKICHDYCDENGLSLTIQKADFIYYNSVQNHGYFIEFINFPRTPQSNWDVVYQARRLSKILMDKFSINKLIILTPEQSFLVEKGDVL